MRPDESGPVQLGHEAAIGLAGGAEFLLELLEAAAQVADKLLVVL